MAIERGDNDAQLVGGNDRNDLLDDVVGVRVNDAGLTSRTYRKQMSGGLMVPALGQLSG